MAAGLLFTAIVAVLTVGCILFPLAARLASIAWMPESTRSQKAALLAGVTIGVYFFLYTRLSLLARFTHDDLMNKLGTYRRLYDLQFVDLEPPKVNAAPE